MTRFKFIK